MGVLLLYQCDTTTIDSAPAATKDAEGFLFLVLTRGRQVELRNFGVFNAPGRSVARIKFGATPIVLTMRLLGLDEELDGRGGHARMFAGS